MDHDIAEGESKRKLEKRVGEMKMKGSDRSDDEGSGGGSVS